MSAVRATAQSSPPLALIHSIWSTSSQSVATAGVLYVWSLVELSSAVARSSDGGIQRSEPASDATRSSAAGENSPIHSPPSEPKFFCGAK